MALTSVVSSRSAAAEVLSSHATRRFTASATLAKTGAFWPACSSCGASFLRRKSHGAAALPAIASRRTSSYVWIRTGIIASVPGLGRRTPTLDDSSKELQGQSNDVAVRHDAERLDLQLVAVEVVPEAHDQRLIRERFLWHQRQQVAAARLLGHAGVRDDQTHAGRVLDREGFADNADAAKPQRADRVLVRQRILQVRLDVLDHAGEVAPRVATNLRQVRQLDRPGEHAVPADARIEVAGIDAQLFHLRDLEKAVVALDVLDGFVRAERLRHVDAAGAEVHPDAAVDEFFACHIVIGVE